MRSEILETPGAVYLAFTFDRALDGPQVKEMAEVVDRAMKTSDDLRLLLDMRATEEFDADAFLSPSGFVTSVKSIGPITRYAVVGAPRIAEVAVETFGKILPLESHAFAPEEIEQAQIWLERPLD
jgi:hypothetical protein